MGGDLETTHKRTASSGKLMKDLSSNRNGRNNPKKKNNMSNFKLAQSTKTRAKSKLPNGDLKKKKEKILIEALNKEPEPTTTEEKV